jgi:hypothetical protein
MTDTSKTQHPEFAAIEARREAAKVPAIQAIRRAGLSSSTVHRWRETGEVSKPKTLQRYADAVDALIREKEEAAANPGA